ncbi:MAG: GDP-mannose 4,6-dehydratase [Verrucomicrobiales bacterium]
MHVLVTGGAGFIGSHTVERLLSAGHGVTVFDDFNDFYAPAIKRETFAKFADQVTLVEGDIRDQSAVARAFETKPDAVIHLAARAGVRPSLDNPAFISRRISTAHSTCSKPPKPPHVKQFVFASSSSVYGVNKKVPFAEADPIERTISPYAATKLAGEQLCSNFSHLYGMRTICLRFFTVYGPRQRPDLAISKFTRLILEGKPIPRYGKGDTSRDYTYVEDIVDGVMGALAYQDSDFEIINLGGSQTVTLNELIETVEAALGQKAVIDEQPEQPGDVPRTSADVAKARKLLGFEPKTPVSAGVPKFVEWYQASVAAAE